MKNFTREKKKKKASTKERKRERNMQFRRQCLASIIAIRGSEIDHSADLSTSSFLIANPSSIIKRVINLLGEFRPGYRAKRLLSEERKREETKRTQNLLAPTKLSPRHSQHPHLPRPHQFDSIPNALDVPFPAFVVPSWI